MFDKKEKYYIANVYSEYWDYAVANVRLDEVSLEDLLDELSNHPNHIFREFSLILVTEVKETEEWSTSKNIIAIYNKNIWDRKLEYCKLRLEPKIKCHVKYICEHRSHSFSRMPIDILPIDIPCNNQEELIDKFESIYNLLNIRTKKKNKAMQRVRKQKL